MFGHTIPSCPTPVNISDYRKPSAKQEEITISYGSAAHGGRTSGHGFPGRHVVPVSVELLWPDRQRSLKYAPRHWGQMSPSRSAVPSSSHSRPQLSQWISPASSCPASKKEVGESSPCRSAGVRPRPSATAWLFRVSSDEPEPALASDRTTPLSVACSASSGSAGPSPSVPVGDAPASTCSSCVFAGRGSSVLAAPSDAVPVASCGPLPPTSGSPSGVSGGPPAVRSFARFSPSSLPRLSGAAGLSSTPGRPRPGPATAPARCGTSPRGRRTGGRLGTPDRSVPSPSDGPRAVPRTPWNHGRAPAVCTGHP